MTKTSKNKDVLNNHDKQTIQITADIKTEMRASLADINTSLTRLEASNAQNAEAFEIIDEVIAEINGTMDQIRGRLFFYLTCKLGTMLTVRN